MRTIRSLSFASLPAFMLVYEIAAGEGRVYEEHWRGCRG